MKKILTISFLILSMFLIAFLAIKIREKNILLDYQVEQNQIKVKVLQDSLSKVKLENEKKLSEYKESLVELEEEYKRKIFILQSDYMKEKEKIKNLPIDKQVELLALNINKEPSPELKIIDRDTIITLKPIHVIEINSMYLEFNYVLEKYETCQDSREELKGKIEEGLKLIEDKNKEVNLCKDIIKTKEEIILGLLEIQDNNKKETRKKVFKAVSIGGLSGLIVGAATILLIF